MIVIDSSVAFKWLVPENDSVIAERLIGHTIVAPDFILLECGNAVWKTARRNGVEELAVTRSLAVIEEFVELVPTGPLIWDALAIARSLDHPIYDCVFLALAERDGIPLVTADVKFQNKVKAAAPSVAVTLLADWQPA